MTTTAPAAEAATPERRCENCGAALLGEHCYECGQPTKGLVRHFSSIMGDFFDSVLNIDSRVLRTLWPLLARPGYLSLEYFAGRRVRYVTPMRLYLFLSVIMFFAIQGNLDVEESGPGGLRVNQNNDSIAAATTPEQVDQVMAQLHKQLAKAKADSGDTPGVATTLNIAEQQLQEHAKQQRDYLVALEKARADGGPAPKPPKFKRTGLSFDTNGKPWDPATNPLSFAWLPAPANAALNRRLGHARDVLASSDSEKPLVDGLFNVLPQTLFVLMPLFALMLKLAYVFKRRLYMEHLIVALHSHSFISLALTLMVALSWLRAWLAPAEGFFHGLFGWGMGLIALWIPVYLLVMQKRVYGQGWPMTLLKYGVLGVSYSILLGFALVAAMLIGLLTL